MKINVGKGIELEVPAFNTLSDEVQAHIIRTGWRNLLQDAHAGVTEAKANGGDIVELSRAAAVRKLEALTRGELRTASTREGDPIKAEALRLAMIGVKNKHREEGKKIGEKDIKAKAREFLASPGPALDKLMAKAKRNVKEAIEIAL